MAESVNRQSITTVDAHRVVTERQYGVGPISIAGVGIAQAQPIGLGREDQFIKISSLLISNKTTTDRIVSLYISDFGVAPVVDDLVITLVIPAVNTPKPANNFVQIRDAVMLNPKKVAWAHVDAVADSCTIIATVTSIISIPST